MIDIVKRFESMGIAMKPRIDNTQIKIMTIAI